MERRGVLFVLCFLFRFVNCNENVPVLIWNTQESTDVNFPAISALQQISVPSLQARYFDDFQPKNILFFLQDALSIEDLSSHGSEMQHVNEWMESSKSLYLPNVVQPAQLQHLLAQQGYQVTSLSAGSAVSELKLEEDKNNLVVVKLPPTLTNPSRSRALRKADEVMQSVLSKVGSLADFTVIYSALQPSVEDAGDQSNEEHDTHARIARSLQQFGNTRSYPDNFHNGGCILMYFPRNMTINLDASNENSMDYEIPEITVGVNVTSCKSDAQMMRLKYSKVELGDTTYDKVSLSFYFTLDRWYWRVSTIDVELNKDSKSTGSTTTVHLAKFKDLSVPVGKSYSCTPPLYYWENVSTKVGMKLVLNGVQAEAFIVNGTDTPKFSDSWDCVGFFTIGIWSGLLATLLLVVILTIGLAMLADIKTMDRFDDPKGKTIVVPNAHD
ncbi:ATPase V1 complex subunit S1 [Trinorchestia longiramus]|nr:ATPase V1 complex subunit S1 [Trinorchestia longiramus]